jgi:WD40 repeat protein
VPRLLVGSGDELVERLEFSQDGSMLTVVRRDGSITRWDVTTGEPLVEVASAFVSPVIAVGQAGRIVRLADSVDGAVVESDLQAPDPDPRHESGDAKDAALAAVGPGALRALAFADGLVRVSGGAAEGFRFQPARRSTSLAFAPDGRSLVTTATNGMVAVWDLEAKAEVARLNGRDLGNQPTAVAFRPAGEPMVAIAAVDGSLTLWRVGIEAALAAACKVAARNLSADEWDRYVGSSRPRTKTCPAYSLDDQP